MPRALLLRVFSTPTLLLVSVGLWPENEDEVGVPADATSGDEEREEGVGDLSTSEAVEESLNFEGIFDCDPEEW